MTEDDTKAATPPTTEKKRNHEVVHPGSQTRALSLPSLPTNYNFTSEDIEVWSGCARRSLEIGVNMSRVMLNLAQQLIVLSTQASDASKHMAQHVSHETDMLQAWIKQTSSRIEEELHALEAQLKRNDTKPS